MSHSYEEIRGVALDILSRRETVEYPPNQLEHLRLGVAEVFSRREHSRNASHGDDDILLEVFWALFRGGIITLGLNSANPAFPWFRLTKAGEAVAAGAHPYFFHDLTTYEAAITKHAPEIHAVTLVYLKEAMQAFMAGCLLSATVMLGVAAEHSFKILLESAVAKEPWKSRFRKVADERTILPKVNRFKAILDNNLAEVPGSTKEDLDTHFAGILSIIRTSRNEAGHPTGKVLPRETVYVLLQLFISYCRKLYQLRALFETT